jgi:phage terminase small subunit
MDKPSRKALREAINNKGISSVLQIPRNALTKKQKRFAEAIALEDMTGADAYRAAYSPNAKPKTAGDNASKLRADTRIKQEIEALERAKELAAWHSAESLKALVVSTLTEVATDPSAKASTRVSAVKVLGSVVGVDMFRETKRIEHVKDSGELRQQILDQLKTVMLGTSDAQEVDANSLLEELTSQEPHPPGTPPNAERDSDAHIHTIPLKPSPEISDPSSEHPLPSEDPPLSSKTQTPGGDIFGENP